MPEKRTKQAYRVLADGLDWPPERHADKGDVVDDLLPQSIGWLLDQNLIRPTRAKVGTRDLAALDQDEEEGN